MCVFLFIDDVSISGYKVALSDPSAVERATEVMVQDGEDAQSPEAVSATSQSTDEHAKDLVQPSLTLLCTLCVFAPPPTSSVFSFSYNFTVFSSCIVLNGVRVCVHAPLQVSVLVLKVRSVCASLNMRGDNTTLALEVGQIRTNQLGNVSLRQYLSNHSLGKTTSVGLLCVCVRVFKS